MQKKLLAILLTLCMLLSAFPLAIFAEDDVVTDVVETVAEEVTDPAPDAEAEEVPVEETEDETTPAGEEEEEFELLAEETTAEETEETPDPVETFVIASAAEVQTLMSDTTKWNDNITISAEVTDPIDISGITQNPIGTDALPFTGTFNGNGKTITGINMTITEGGGYGFFGYVGASGVNTTENPVKIENLTVEGTISGEQLTAAGNNGGLIAYSRGALVVDHCTNNVDVSAELVSGGDHTNNCGGILGIFAKAGSTVTITNCVNNGDLYATRYVGSMVGYAGSGVSTLTIKNCTNNGALETKWSIIGGIVGSLVGGSLKTVTIENCINDGTVTAGSFYAGGMIDRKSVV